VRGPVKAVLSSALIVASFGAVFLSPGGAQADQMISSANQHIQANPANYAVYAIRAMGEAASDQNNFRSPICKKA